MFPPELEAHAFRAGDEFGWTRAQIPLVIDVLRSQRLGILGGELWWVNDTGWCGSIPQRQGPPGVYTWVTERRSDELWEHFVDRGISDAIAAVERWPEPGDLPPDLPGRILYNLTWVSEAGYDTLGGKTSDNVSANGV